MKRLRQLLLVVMTVMLLVSCTPEPAAEDEDSEGSLESPNSESSEAVDDPWSLPAIDGFQKQVQTELVIYSSHSGSTILVQPSQASEAVLAAMRDKDATAPELTMEIDAIFGALPVNGAVQGTFETIGEADVFAAYAQLDSGESIVFYKALTTEDKLFDLTGTAREENVSEPMQAIIAALTA